MEVIQKYLIDGDNTKYGFNSFINKNLCKIEINLNSIMERKNMAFKKIVKKINDIFLLEFLCAFLDYEGLWSEKLCGDGYNCNIKKILKKISFFLE